MDTIKPAVVILCIFYGIICANGGEWSQWRTLTRCTAKPCRCGGSNESCKKGEMVQMRICELDGIEACQFDGAGSMRKTECKNKNVCPGWSEWQVPEESVCKCDRGSTNGNRTVVRYCNKPPPIHPKVLCKTNYNGSDIEEEDERPCECKEEGVRETTTLPDMTSETGLPCCTTNGTNDYDSYAEYLNRETTATAATIVEGTVEPLSPDVQEDLNQYYDNGNDPDCRPCNDTDVTTVAMPTGST